MNYLKYLKAVIISSIVLKYHIHSKFSTNSCFNIDFVYVLDLPLWCWFIGWPMFLEN